MNNRGNELAPSTFDKPYHDNNSPVDFAIKRTGRTIIYCRCYL